MPSRTAQKEVQNFDIIVVGAGAIGAACALRLARDNPALNICVVERARAPIAAKRDNQRVWALGHAAMSMLNELGLRASLPIEVCYPYSNMLVWDAHSDGELSFDAADYQQPALGFMVDAEVCSEVLQQALLSQANIHFKCDFHGTQIEFVNGYAELVGRQEGQQQELRATLVIAADGAHSWVRSQSKILAPARPYLQRGIVAKISTEASHRDTAWQRFLSTGPIAVLPLAGNTSSIVWSADETLADRLLSLSEVEFAEQLEAALESRLGNVKVLTRPQAFPLQSQHAERYCQANLVLIGDAAHSIHPLAGQGANLGFKDVAALTSLLKDVAASQLGDYSLLSKYQRQRRLDNLQTDILMTTLQRAFQNNAPLWTLARGRGMRWLSANRGLKSLFAKQAMGL